MSGEIDFSANNLCATEEAFENFQANSMYEEDEFITLSDILPPQPKIPDISTAIEEMPSENDIVSSTLDDQVCYQSGQTKPHRDVNKVLEFTVDDTSSKSKRKPPGSTAKRRKRKNYSTFTKKRGKKPKSKTTSLKTLEGISENVIDNCNVIDLENVICGTEIKKETTASETPHRQRRRTKKPTPFVTTEKYNDVPPLEIVSSNEACSDPTSNVQEQIFETNVKHGKRSLKKNSLKAPKCTSSSQSTSSLSTKGGPEKKRRGRPKKQSSENMTDNNVVQQVNGDKMENDVSDDDMDDISLSKLKETIEPLVSDFSSSSKLNEFHKSTVLENKPADNKQDDLKKSDVTNEISYNISRNTSKEVESTGEIIENNNTVNTTLEDGVPTSTSVQAEDTKKVKSSKRKSKSLLKSDYEYNVDKVIITNDEDHVHAEQNTSNVPVDIISASEEDGSKRPTRKKAKQTHYEVESDEDPFANVELSDDEPRRKGYRYDFDDEYKPGRKHDRISTDSDSALDELEDDDLALGTKSKRKRIRKKSDIGTVNKSPKKKRKNSDESFPKVTTITPDENCEPDDDIEGCLQSSVIKTSEETIVIPQSWGSTHEFESFLAKKIHGSDLKIKKVTATTSSDAVITPLEIPVINPKETKKVKEIFTQTVQSSFGHKKTVSIQTSVPSMVPMKDNIALTPMQSQNACEFLKSIVKTTAELGQLMTQKSEDFIKKKINTEHIKDTFKMDYCVNKSFLLLKLAKHNLTQMEEDLTKQYEEFLKVNDLLSCREQLKKITPKPKDTNSDSDCEIVGETTQVKKEKPKFNPKTVFLNKELSIKIAKKTTEETKPKEKMNIKGRHTVWISDSVMVKKVKPSQSFLAQDSRNKKPPDNFVTEKMVKDFFKGYYKKKSQSICAPFVTADWFSIEKRYICNYFLVNEDKFSKNTGDPSEHRLLADEIQNENSIVNDTNETICIAKVLDISSPETLLSLSINALQKCLCETKVERVGMINHIDDKVLLSIVVNNPETLLQLCLKRLLRKSGAINKEYEIIEKFIENNTTMEQNTLDYYGKNINGKYLSMVNTPNTLVQLCIRSFSGNGFTNKKQVVDIHMSKQSLDTLKLKSNCFLEENGNYMTEKCFINKEQISNTHDVELQLKLEEHDENKMHNALCNLAEINTPKSLFQLCMKTFSETLVSYEEPDICDNKFLEIETKFIILPLKTLCLQRISEFLEKTNKENTVHSNSLSHFEKVDDDQKIISDGDSKNISKSLFKICVKFIQHEQKCKFIDINTSSHLSNRNSYGAQSLIKIAFQNVTNMLYRSKFLKSTNMNACEGNGNNCYKVNSLSNFCFQCISTYFNNSTYYGNTVPTDTMTINSVNTMSEEAFLRIAETDSDANNDLQYMADEEETNYDEDDFQDNVNDFQDNVNDFQDNVNDFQDNFNDFPEGSQTEDNNWFSQLQMEELRSCSMPSKLTLKQVKKDQQSTTLEDELMVARIKIEPLDDIPENIDQPIVKTEPIHNLDEMTMIPENVVTKQENPDYLNNITEDSQRRESYDDNAFEAFIRSNKMRSNNTEFYDEIFSQSTSRIRRQYEPDSDNENDSETNMSLLIPQTFEPLNVETAKGTLMETSSEEENTSNKKNTAKDKKKNEKRRGRPKKTDVKNNSTSLKENVVSKDNMAREKSTYSEVAMITRKMKERIRQEEKKNLSSDSESENVPLSKRKEKEVNDRQKLIKSGKGSDAEIQCNNVDSTEQIVDSINNDNVESNTFSGFSAVDQNEIASYEKYMKYVYDKIIPKVVSEVTDNNQNISQNVNSEENYSLGADENYDMELPLINPDEPVELLECEPTMPIFDTCFDKKVKRGKTAIKSIIKTRSESKVKITKESKGLITEENIPEKNIGNAKQIIEASERQIKQINEDDSIPKKEMCVTINIKKEVEEITNQNNKEIIEKPAFIERHGWNCYPITTSDPKLYQLAHIPLEKLPESFVDTYFQYQDITDKSKEDAEVDRLTNLQSLRRMSGRDAKQRIKQKSKVSTDGQVISGQDVNSGAASPVYSDHYAAELTPSEDEGVTDDEVSPPVENQVTENCLAKNSLMNDNDSETEEQKPVLNVIPTIKQEPTDEVPVKKSRPGPKSSKFKMEEPADFLMLTADKMMNKELTLLHAPIVLTDQVPETPTKGISPKVKHKTGLRSSEKKDRIRSGDESSEEEKQWVTTKEKLLKRLIKKQEDTSGDDAKRAKLVSEYIERRGALPAPDARIKSRGRPRRSKKKMLERQKQLSVLSRELFGESSTYSSKKHSQTIFKGRRNIRKVLDKKSLARSTVVANMEEFERKRRLGVRQSQLREVLGCEEGVNVLVINDEVCLEYDFEEMRPVVTIHPFFTKVMKAHQYEGVKFMWDACFESLAVVESGHPGGGCILAHCMGLGKTLQVLALLHTVLTHPRVGMQRVLVCCPLSTVLNWVDEIHKWIGPVTDQIKVFELSKLKKTYERAYQLEDWYKGGGIFIIGYELFRSLSTLDPVLDRVKQPIINKIRSALLDPGPDIIICDEGHLLKNDCSVLAVAMSRVVTKRRIVLTGTPMQNNLREYYCMVNFVKPNLLGTYAEYSNRFENPIMNGQHRDSQEQDIKLMKARTHILHKVLEGCLQRQEASVLYPYLPKKHEYTVFISLTKCQSVLYKHYLQMYANKSKQSVLKDFHILQKIWSHPQVLHHFQMKDRDEVAKIKEEKLEDDLAREDLAASEDVKPGDTEVWWLQYLDGGNMLDSIESSNKFVAVFRILDECVALGDKVLIFSTSLFTMDALEYFLKKINNWSLGQEYYRLDGSVPAEVRQKWCREFNAENNIKTKLFLISTRAGSLGLNMTAANRVIILDTSWNPAHDIQSIFRVYRFGQKKDCYIYRLVALGTMEQKIYERSVTKQAVACRVVDEQQIDRHYNMAELTELYRFDELGVGVAGGVAVGVRDVVLLRVARDAALHAVHEHDSLLRGSSEQALNEHERDAAWLQFHEEYKHKESLAMNPVVKTPLKRLHLENHKEPPVIKQELIKVEKDADYTPYEPKAKRGRKKAVINCDIPITAPTPVDDSCHEVIISDRIKDKEEILVEKISSILIRHNFHSKRGPKEISELISNVRKVVASGRMEDLSGSDELTMSIANVLLQKEEPTMPPLTDVHQATTSSSSEAKTEHYEKKRGRPRKKPRVKQKEAPLTSFDSQETIEDISESDGRKKRRAALAAEKHLGSIAKDLVIDLDNDDDWQRNESDTEVITNDVTEPFVTNVKQTEEKQKTPSVENNNPKYRPGPKSKKIEKSIVKAEKIDETYSQNQNTTNADMESIILSDDDEPQQQLRILETNKMLEPKKQTVKKPEAAKIVIKTEVVEDNEKVPLHPSLLSNKNFIKIVAHTYLAGNPMLDEDAATLAAQYSTFRTLQELEATGKPIDSGPIYDIAVKVLGLPILKKLNKTSPKLNQTGASSSKPVVEEPRDKKKDQENNEPITKKGKMTKITKEDTPETIKQERLHRDPSVNTKPKPTPEVTTSDTPNLGFMSLAAAIANSARVEVPSENAAHVATAKSAATPAVVPVGLIQSAVNVPALGTSMGSHQSGDECILPDDDDLHIVSASPPTPVSISTAFPAPTSVSTVKYPVHTSTPIENLRRNRPIILNTGLAKGKPMLSQTVQISEGKIILAPSTSVQSNLQSSFQTPIRAGQTLTKTISLDSDDEDETISGVVPQVTNQIPMITRINPVSSQVVPVSLTKVNSTPNVPHLNQEELAFDFNKSQHVNQLKSNTQNVGHAQPNQLISILDKKKTLSKVNKLTKVSKSVVDAALKSKTQGITQEIAQPSDNVKKISSQNETPEPVNTDVKHKTVCKPGDIIRIGKNGKLEILNRGDNACITLDDDDSIITTDEKTTPTSKSSKSMINRQTVTEQSTSKKSKENEVAKVKVNSLNETPKANEKSTARVRNISSSSSSSSRSRSQSPSDPLSILRDVVHIRADTYEDTNKSKKSADATKTLPSSVAIRKTSISTSSSNTGKVLVGLKNKTNVDSMISNVIATPSKLSQDQSKSKAVTPSTSKNSTPIKPSTISERGDFIRQLSSKSDLILKKLNNILGSPKDNKRNASVIKPAETVDLTGPASTSKAIDKLGKNILISKTDSKDKSPILAKAKTDKKESSSTVIGTSNTIIISASGKTVNKVMPKKTTKDPSSGRGIVRVTNMETLKPSIKALNDPKKRPFVSTDSIVPKKKKTEVPMTLKDFNLDDIDDIIELD